MIIQDVISSKKYKNEDNLQSIKASYKKSGIGHKLIYNHTKKIMTFTQYIKDMKNQFILSPYGKNSCFIWYIHPGEINCFLTMEIDSKLKSTICQKSKCFYMKKYIPKKNPINISEYINEKVFREYITNSYYDYQTISLEKAKEDLKFEKIDLSQNIFNQIAFEEQDLMNKILKLNPVEYEKNLFWINQKNEKEKYVGQINKNKEKEGRGALVTQNNIYIGYFNNNKQNGEGTIYDLSLDHIIYKGNFINGIKNGKGIFYYKNGDKYEGDFINDKKEGFGIFYFKSGNTWEGTFNNDKMNGEGIFKGKKMRKVTYINGILQK